MNSEIKLEVGKTYEVRDPEKAKKYNWPDVSRIISRDKYRQEFPFMDDDNVYYSENGVISIEGLNCFDLVREVIIYSTNKMGYIAK